MKLFNVMLLLSFLLCLSVVLFGCKTRKVAKESYSRESVSRTESAVKLTDTGTVTTKEVTTTSFLSGPLIATKAFEIPRFDLLKSLSSNLYRLDSAMLDISVGYDTLKNALVINAHKRPEQTQQRTERTTTERKGITKEETQKQNTRDKEKKESKQTESKPDYSWMWWLVGIIGILFLILYLWNKISSGAWLSGIFKLKQ